MDGLPYGRALSEALRKARAMLMPFYGQAPNRPKEGGGAANVVTDQDYMVEDYLRVHLNSFDPGVGVVGEEYGGDRNAERFWLIDPIDGTGYFTRGIALCTSMLALVEYGEVVASFIYDFVRDELYKAERGRGATLNGMPLRVSERSLAEAYVGYEICPDDPQGRKAISELGSRCVLQKIICSGYEHAMVASGKLEGRICLNPFGRDYDYAPGALLVVEAGGRVANIGSEFYDYRNLDFIAANPLVFEALIQGPEALFPIV